MALVTEDGTGLADAESLCSVATADEHFALRGSVEWAALPTEGKEQALRRATDYMEAVFAPWWMSERLTTTQALEWPRYGYSTVPTLVQRACAELALRSIAGPLMPDRGPQVAKETVGPVSVLYAPGARQSTAYTSVWAMLGPYLKDAVELRRA